ncbi:MAG: hypothetical protein D6761_09975, partial [Candidatus Dadabacteria bacterium]
AADAVARGATGVVVERDLASALPETVAVYRVDNTLDALMQLAEMKRRAYRGTVVTLTGSAGKTTAKHFVSQLAGRGVSVTKGNFNNQIGVPLSIFEASLRSRAWVLELGMNAAGEIGALTSLVRPDLGVLLPAGRAHLGHFENQQDVVAAKAEMLRVAEAPRRVLTVGTQYDAWVPSGIEQVRIGSGGQYDARARRIVFPTGTQFSLVDQHQHLTRVVGVHGAHFSANLAAAWAIVRECGFRRAAALERLSDLESPSGRMTLRALRGGWLLDDSYNASPESFLAFARWLSQVPLPPRLVLADMRELGSASAALHDEVAAALLAMPLDRVIAVEGELAESLRCRGCPVSVARDADEAVEQVLAEWQPGVLAAVKGANGSGLYAALRRRGL